MGTTCSVIPVITLLSSEQWLVEQEQPPLLTNRLDPKSDLLLLYRETCYDFSESPDLEDSQNHNSLAEVRGLAKPRLASIG